MGDLIILKDKRELPTSSWDYGVTWSSHLISNNCWLKALNSPQMYGGDPNNYILEDYLRELQILVPTSI